jgi:hypothetical protein
MTDLSSPAQAVINAAVEAGGGYGRATPVLHARLAAALRAAADQVVPQALCVYNPESISIRSQLLAIANELEAQ